MANNLFFWQQRYWRLEFHFWGQVSYFNDLAPYSTCQRGWFTSGQLILPSPCWSTMSTLLLTSCSSPKMQRLWDVGRSFKTSFLAWPGLWIGCNVERSWDLSSLDLIDHRDFSPSLWCKPRRRHGCAAAAPSGEDTDELRQGLRAGIPANVMASSSTARGTATNTAGSPSAHSARQDSGGTKLQMGPGGGFAATIALVTIATSLLRQYHVASKSCTTPGQFEQGQAQAQGLSQSTSLYYEHNLRARAADNASDGTEYDWEQVDDSGELWRTTSTTWNLRSRSMRHSDQLLRDHHRTLTFWSSSVALRNIQSTPQNIISMLCNRWVWIMAKTFMTLRSVKPIILAMKKFKPWLAMIGIRCTKWSQFNINGDRYFLVENPVNSRLWTLQPVKTVLSWPNVWTSTLDTGAFGAEIDGRMIAKPMMFMGNVPGLGQIINKKWLQNRSSTALQSKVGSQQPVVSIPMPWSTPSWSTFPR